MKPVVLHAANPGPMTGDGNRTYLIPGDRPVLIDAGVGAPSHLEAIDTAAAGRAFDLVVTHAHSDHIAGAPEIVRRWPATRLFKMPWPIRDRDLEWTPLADGAVVETGHGDLAVVHTPGHAPDHVCLWHHETRTLFVGDMLVQGSTVVIPASHGGSIAEYLGSLEKLLALNPRRALPAHGPVIDDPQALMHSYIEHRAQRESQVMAELAPRPVTVDELVAAIYPNLAAAIVPMARESVLAHLIKLEDERRAARDGDHWSLVR